MFIDSFETGERSDARINQKNDKFPYNGKHI